MLKGLSRSLSFRLLAIFLVLGGLFVYGTFLAIQRVYNSEQIRGLISGHLSLHVNYVRQDIGVPPRIDRALAITERVPVDIRILGPDVNWASDPNFPRIHELEFAPSPRFSDSPDAWADELTGVDFADKDNHDFLRMRQGGYDIVISTPRIAQASEGPLLLMPIIGMGLALLVFGYAAVSWLFRPIRTIREGASAIGRGRLDHRIENIRRDQLGDLANDINVLAGDVERMLDAKRALLLGISHELRTPLSRMRLALEFLDDEKDAETLRAEILEMEKIVQALLEAERLNVRHAQLARAPTSISNLIDNLINDFFSRDRDRVMLELPEEALIGEVDEARITLMLKNLVANALHYSKPGDGPVEISSYGDGDSIVVRVTDHGPGLSESQQQHIGEPFYRADPSRTRDSGGTGLGLYLATLVATAHGGQLEYSETDGGGATFTVRLPAA